MNLDNFLRLLPFERFRNPAPVVAVLRLNGVIGGRGPRGLTLERLSGMIERAFMPRHLKAVALAISSPGGSPVQSALIQRRIRQLAQEKQVPVIAFAEDVAASGGYWLALAADEIYAEAASLVGSIGVVSSGFGFTELIQRWGIERRLYTAGRSKSLLDPFLSEDPRDVERLGRLQQDLHDTFKALVEERRGAKLDKSVPELFEGEVFSGRRAVELGLIDGIGDLRGVLRGRFGDRVRLRFVEPSHRSWQRWRPFFPGAQTSSADWVAECLAMVEERLLWDRFGL